MVGMLPRQQDLVRPLLCVSRAEILDYCYEHGLEPLEDHSNTDPRFVRNRLRHEVIPVLREINPGLRETLQRNAEIARVDLAWLDEQIDNIWPTLVHATNDGGIELDVPALLALPLSLRRHALRRVTGLLYDGQSPLEPRHLQLIEKMLSKNRNHRERALDLPLGMCMLQVKDHVSFVRRALVEPETDYGNVQTEGAVLRVPGSCFIPGTRGPVDGPGWQAHASLLEDEITPILRTAILKHDWDAVSQCLPRPIYKRWSQTNLVFMDADALGDTLLVRTWQPGDRIQP
jgi:tRNA(Ile)-lysidine synthase